MGYKVASKLFKFVWPEDHDLHGLEITAKALSFADWNNLRAVADGDDTTVWDLQEQEVESFVEHVEAWNLEGDDGKPLPVTSDALLLLDRVRVVEVVSTWIKRSLGIEVPVPLDDGSTRGEQRREMEASLPQVTS